MLSQSVVGVFASTLPVEYHLSPSCTISSAKVSPDFWFHCAPICAPRECTNTPCAGAVSVQEMPRSDRGSGVTSLGPKKYKPLSFGMPAGREGRTAYLNACCNFRGWRFWTSRIDSIRTLKWSWVMISDIKSEVTDNPSRMRVWTSCRMCLFRRVLNIYRRGPP